MPPLCSSSRCRTRFWSRLSGGVPRRAPVSFDDDHVVADLRERFDDVLLALEDSQGRVTARLKPPVRIFGSLDGVETGVRNLIRTRPLEVERVAGGPSRPAGRGRRAAHPGRLLRDQRGSGGHRIATQVAKQLAEPAPGDLGELALTAYGDCSDAGRTGRQSPTRPGHSHWPCWIDSPSSPDAAPPPELSGGHRSGLGA